MHICFITTNVLIRHANMKRALGLAPHLIQAGHEVTIYMEDAPENRAAVNDIPGCRALFFQNGSWWHERRQKRGLLRGEKFDFVHFCGLGWRNVVLPGIEFDIPAIMDHAELESSFINTPILRRMAQWMLEFASPVFYPNTVAASKYLQELFQKRLEWLGLKRNILYLPFASDGDITGKAPALSAELRLGFDSHKLVLYMGSLYQAYGVLDLLDTLIELRKRRADWMCVYLGDGEARRELERRAQLAGLTEVIRFPGRVSDEEMAAYMDVADVFVSPLRDTVRDWARCPSKTYIYMMFEKPIVTCPIGENLNSLGEDGFYYTPGDPDSMGFAIERALDVSAEWHPAYRKEGQTWQARASAYERWLLAIRDNSFDARN